MTPWLKQANGEKITNLKKRKSDAKMGGVEKVAKHHAKGKRDARQRIQTLLDGGAFTEVGQLAGHEVDAFVSGIGILNGHPVAIGCEDFTVKGGSIGRAESANRYRIAELALQERIP